MIVMGIGVMVPIFIGLEVLPFSGLGVPLIVAQSEILFAVDDGRDHIALLELASDGIDCIFERKIGISGQLAEVSHNYAAILFDLLYHF